MSFKIVKFPKKILAECTHTKQGPLSNLCCNTCSLKEKNVYHEPLRLKIFS